MVIFTILFSIKRSSIICLIELQEHFLSVNTYPSFGKRTTLVKLSNALFLGTSHASSLHRTLRLLSLRRSNR